MAAAMNIRPLSVHACGMHMVIECEALSRAQATLSLRMSAL